MPVNVARLVAVGANPAAAAIRVSKHVLHRPVNVSIDTGGDAARHSGSLEQANKRHHTIGPVGQPLRNRVLRAGSAVGPERGIYAIRAWEARAGEVAR
eukprot:scaffold26582_cov40-Tisochrysis_lutea.AAC.1